MDNPPGELNNYITEYKNGLFIEPVPDAFVRLQKVLNDSNIKNNTNYIGINELITDKSGEDYKFYIYQQNACANNQFDMKYTEVSSSLFNQNTINSKKLWGGGAPIQTNEFVNLKSKTITEVLKENNWDNKKYDCVIDTQGSELLVLKGFSHLNNIEKLTIECSTIEIYKGGVLFDELHNYLISKNFKLIKAPSSHHCDIIYVNSQ